MRTLAQMEASKTNGAKSRGPKTEEGRARSSQNACKHGLSAKKIVVIDGESEEEFQTLHQDFINRFRPQDPIEARLVLEIAVNQWRLERSWALQVSTVNQEIPAQEKRAKALYKVWDTELVTACAFNSRRESLQALGHLETRLARNIDRALRKLRDLRSKFPPAPAALTESQNEPESQANGTAPESEKRTQAPPEPPNVPANVIELPVVSTVRARPDAHTNRENEPENPNANQPSGPVALP